MKFLKKGAGKWMTLLIIFIIIAVAVWMFSNDTHATKQSQSKATLEETFDDEEESTQEPPYYPIEDGICHGLLCYSGGTTPTYAVVMLKDYSKLEGAVNGCFDARTLEEFKQVAHSEALMTLGYFLLREQPDEELEFKDEYQITINNEEYLCKIIHDDRIDIIPLEDNFFPEEDE